MMVLDTQPESNEDSQGRQIRVNKKLSKAISSVPRSRFIKPRPNLPGAKRTDSSSVVVSTRKPVEAPKDESKAEAAILNAEEKPQKVEEENKKNDVLLNINEISLKTEETNKKDDTVQCLDEISQKIEETNKKDDTVQCLGEKSEQNNSNKPALSTQEESEQNNSNNSTLSTHEKSEQNNSKSSALNSHKKSDQNNSNNSILSSPELLEKTDDSCVAVLNTTDGGKHATDTSTLNTNKTPQKEGKKCTEISNAEKVPLEDEHRSTKISNAVSSLSSSVQVRNEAAQVSTTISDRSSKYPHLTSILTKKRTEPKKEVQHKRRKKFKKGDVAPERSKMTMADLIYWNPTNTNEPAKSAVITEERPNILVVEEEENVDGDVGGEETNMLDSVPKLVISEDGTINIDQSSLIISRNIPQPTVTEVVRRDDTTYSSFRKRPLTKHWNAKDTTVFYKALSIVGTDFALMEKIFPHRTRRELKQKFKREEKFNIDLINRAMYESHLTFEADTLEDLINYLNKISDDGRLENAGDSGAQVKAKKKPSDKKQKKPKKTKPTDNVHELSDSSNENLPSEAQSTRDVSNKRKRKTKKLPEDFVDFDEIESTLELASEESNGSTLSDEEQKNKKRRRARVLPDDSVDESSLITNVETSATMNQEITVNITNAVSDSLAYAVDSENEGCVPDEYIENIDSVTETSLLSDVMAFEVVTSQSLLKSRRRQTHIPSLPKRKQETILPLILSSSNYTPV